MYLIMTIEGACIWAEGAHLKISTILKLAVDDKVTVKVITDKLQTWRDQFAWRDEKRDIDEEQPRGISKEGDLKINSNE